MANTGNILAGTGENVDRSGLTAWTNPGNITADDGSDAICNGAGSDYLVARNFGFSLPAGVTIKGVFVRVEASEHAGGTEALLAQLQDETGTLVGTEKSGSNEGNISGTAKAVYTYGSTSDLWGATLTQAIVNDVDFGVRLHFATSHEVRIDFVTVAIEYANAYSLTADPGSITVVGQAATLTVQRKLTANAGDISVTGQSANLIRSLKLIADPGTISVSGEAAGLVKGYMMTADAGSVSITGQAASLIAARKISADTGVISITGEAANLLRMLVLTVDPGSISVTGEAANLLRGVKMTADSGTVTITGVDADLVFNGGMNTLPADPGAIVVTGQPATLSVQRYLQAGAGTVTITGQDAALNYTASVTVQYVVKRSPVTGSRRKSSTIQQYSGSSSISGKTIKSTIDDDI